MGAVNRCGNIRLSRIPPLMSMAALLAALLLAASPVRPQTLVKEHQQRLIDASREFVEMSKELSADGTISDHEVQQIRPLIIKLREIIDALPCGAAYWYYDLVGKQRLYKGTGTGVPSHNNQVRWAAVGRRFVPSATRRQGHGDGDRLGGRADGL